MLSFIPLFFEVRSVSLLQDPYKTHRCLAETSSNTALVSDSVSCTVLFTFTTFLYTYAPRDYCILPIIGVVYMTVWLEGFKNNLGDVSREEVVRKAEQIIAP